MEPMSYINLAIAVTVAPFLFGVINRVKAVVAGRTGQPLLQLYFDISKLLKKGAVYSKTTTWVFRAGPVVGLAVVLAGLAFIPFCGIPAPFAFKGDMIMLAYLLGLMRFFTIIAALDTGSSFEGMGASREAQFAMLAEPGLIIGLAAIAKKTELFSLSAMFATLPGLGWQALIPELVFVALAVFIIALCENSRIPFDDPNTHLELTMIHEVMVLDHSGPDFAFISYGASLKMWIFGALFINIALPVDAGNLGLNLLIGLTGILGFAVIVGLVEATMARLRLLRVPHLLAGAAALSALAFVLVLR